MGDLAQEEDMEGRSYSRGCVRSFVPQPGDVIIVDTYTGKCRIERNDELVFGGEGIHPTLTPEHVPCWLQRDSFAVVAAALWQLGYAAEVHVKFLPPGVCGEHRLELLKPLPGPRLKGLGVSISLGGSM